MIGNKKLGHESTTGDSDSIMDLSLSSGVLTLSITGEVLLPGATAGENKLIDLTGYSYTFNDDTHASSHLTNMGFGITETVDWADDMPFFIYLVNEDDTAANIGMFIARTPCLSVTPLAAFIHDKDAAASSDQQYGIFGAWADDAGKASKPCRLIGAIRMRWSTATDDWTVQTLGNTDGIGDDRINKTLFTWWDMPDQQNGANAVANNYLKCTNTPPVWASPANTIYKYRLDLSGWCEIKFSTVLSGSCTNGSNAESLDLPLPFASASSSINSYYIPVGIGRVNANPSGNGDEIICLYLTNAQTSARFYNLQIATIQANDFSDSGDDLDVEFKYRPQHA